MAEFKPQYVNNLVTPAGRISFPHLEKPDSKGKYADNKYKVTQLIPKTANLGTLKKAVLDCAKESWGADVDMKTLLHPFRNGDVKAEKMPMYADHLYITAKSRNRPTMLDASRNGIEAAEVYGGCDARLVVTAMSYEQGRRDGGVDRGVTFLLDVVQKIGDNTRFGGHADISVLDDGVLDDSGADNVVVDEGEPGDDELFGDTPTPSPTSDIDDLLF
jgi:hypothetical protein